MAGIQLETIAYIIKEEKISNVDHDVRSNTFVVETVDPYPGYHGLNVPTEKRHNPEDVFLLTKKRLVAEQIAHITRNVKKQSGIDFDAARADLFFFNDNYPAIRIRGLESYSQVEKLQNWYVDFGVDLAKREKVDASAVIKIQKMLFAEEVEPGVYVDLDDGQNRYFEIPHELTWQQFAAITSTVKRNLALNNFDLALGGVFRRGGLRDFIRVYTSKENELKELKCIQDLFITEVNKL